MIGVGGDGDSKFRKYFTQHFLKFTEEQRRGNSVTIPYESFDFVSVVEEYDNVRTPTVMFPDWRHLIKKWRNQLLNVKRVLFLGNQVVQLEHIIKTYEAHRLESGLWKSDIFVKDKQKVKAATRILSTSVQQRLATWNYQRTVSTQTYLKIGQNMLSAFTEPNISIRERAQLAWSAVSFLRLWKVWINISGYKTEINRTIPHKVKVSALDPDILLERDCNAPKLLPKRRKTGKSPSEPDRDYSRLPSYVEFEGSFFHIAEFLSLQEGKVYRPQTSRISRWMASSQSDFYEQIDKLISPKRTQNGLYLDDFGSFWVPNSGLNIGQIIRILWCPSYKSSYPVFEWKDNPQEKEKTSICIRIWTHIEVGLKWKLHPQNAIQWCDPKMLLEKYHASDTDTEKFIDPSKLKLMLPRLEKLEEERLQKKKKKG